MNNPIDESSSVKYCPNCGGTKIGSYCADCGQKMIRDSDLNIKMLFAEFMDSFIGLDSRFITTARDLIKGGTYVKNWLAHKRARYLPPWKLFLLLNLVYFLLLPLGRFNTYTNKSNSQLNYQIYSRAIRSPVLAIANHTDLTEKEFFTLYDRRVDTISNSLIILLVPLYALLLFAINFRKTKLFYHHLVVGFGLGCMLLFLSLLVNLSVVSSNLLYSLFNLNLNRYITNGTVTSFLMLIFFLYSFFLFKHLYGGKTWVNLLKAIMVAVPIFSVVILTYRFLLLWITLFSVVLFH